MNLTWLSKSDNLHESAVTARRLRYACWPCVQVLLFVVASCFGIGELSAQITPATTQRNAREEAIQSVPFQNLNFESQQKISTVIQKAAMYRRMPVQTVRCDHELHQFLIRYPEVIVSVWKFMGVTSLESKRVAPFTIQSDDGAGTKSVCDLVYGTNNLHIYYGDGSYEGSLIRHKLSGHCLMLIQTKYSYSSTGEPLVSDQLDIFLQIDNAGANAIAKALHPLVGKTADFNFTETEKFLTRMSDLAETNPDGMHRLIDKLEGCDKEVLDRFHEIVNNASNRYSALQQKKLLEQVGSTEQQSGSTPQRFRIYSTGNSTAR